MGFFLTQEKTKVTKKDRPSDEFLHKNGCRACPLNNAKIHSPKMNAVGVEHPELYLIAEAPGELEDWEGEQLVGPAGELLWEHFPGRYKKYIRKNNTINCRPPNNRNPEPIEIECVLGDTKVSPIGKIKTLYKRWYNGPVILFETVKGNYLTITPNHPIMVFQGSRKSKEVVVGDYLVNTNIINNWEFTAEPNRDLKPTTIYQIFSSFSKVSQVDRTNSTSLDFHGDGKNGDINIIRADGELGNRIQSFSSKFSDQINFTISDSTFGILVNDSSFNSYLFIFSVIASGYSLLERMIFVPHQVSLCSISNWCSFFPEIMQNNIASYVFRSSNFLRTFSTEISLNYICDRLPASFIFLRMQPHLFLSSSDCNSFIDQIGFYQRRINFNDRSNIGKTFAFLCIEFDQIKSKRFEIDFSAHVFNLETESNLYTANGFMVCNCCRPRVLADIENTKPRAIFGFGNFPLQWVLNQNGIFKWRGRRIPVKIGQHECWFYPMFHPSFLLRIRKGKNKSIQSDNEIAFKFDLQRAIREVFEDDLPTPFIHGDKELHDGLICIDGSEKWHLRETIQLLEYFSEQEYNGFDLETQNVRPYAKDSEILTIAISNIEKSLSFAWKHPQSKWSEYQINELQKAFINYLHSPSRKCVHHLAFEMEWIAFTFGKDKCRTTLWEDSLSQAFIINERTSPKQSDSSYQKSEDGVTEGLSLELLCLEYFGINIKDIAGKFNKKNMEGESLQRILPYNARDSKYHLYLFLEQNDILEKEGLIEPYKMMLRRVPTVVLTQLKGFPVDFEENKRLEQKYTERYNQIIASLELQPEYSAFRKLTGHNLNYASTKDLQVLLRDIIKTTIGREEDGSYSTSEAILNSIGKPICGLIIDARQMAKMLSTYIYPCKRENVYSDGLLHTKINTTKTATGRFSSEDPNLQNWPKRDSDEKEVRRQISP